MYSKYKSSLVNNITSVNVTKRKMYLILGSYIFPKRSHKLASICSEEYTLYSIQYSLCRYKRPKKSLKLGRPVPSKPAEDGDIGVDNPGYEEITDTRHSTQF